MALPWTRIDAALQAATPVRLSGRVTRVGGLLVEGRLPGARMGMLCRIQIPGDEDATGVPAEIVALKEGRVVLMPLAAVPGVTVGTPIAPGPADPTVGVSHQMVGRVLDGWGRAIDGGPPLQPGPYADRQIPRSFGPRQGLQPGNSCPKLGQQVSSLRIVGEERFNFGALLVCQLTVDVS